MPEKKQQRSEQLPAWRLELSEKVRARKAQQAAEETSGTPLESRPPESKLQTPDSRLQIPNDEPEPVSRDPRAIAAIERVQRASEKAQRARVPRIEPAKALTMQKVSGNGTATAAALDVAVAEETQPDIAEFALLPKEGSDPVVEPFRVPLLEPKDRQKTWQRTESSNPSPRVASLRRVSQSATAPQVSHAEELHHTEIEVRSSEVDSSAHSESTFFGSRSNGHSEVKVERPPVKCIDENFTIDYLEMELQKEAQWLASQPREASELRGPALIILIDLLIIALSCAPFLLMERWILGTTSNSLIILLGLGVLISAFYLFLTQSLCGKTFGMMKMRMHITATNKVEPPTVWQTGLRTASFYLSLLPAFLGFFWVAIDPQHRSWMDLLSGTRLVPDSSSGKK
jgi:uncharacterized RDD family membrane protein YckC